MDKKKRFITYEEAVSLLIDGENVHTFKQGGSILWGCDWSREYVLQGLKNADHIELAGETARGMKHGIVFYNDKDCDPVFVETNEDKLVEFDK